VFQAATLWLAVVAGAGVVAPDGGAPSDGPIASHQSSTPVLVAPPKTTKPGDITHVGGVPTPPVNPDLQGRAALPDSIGDTPLGPPGPPAKPPAGH